MAVVTRAPLSLLATALALGRSHVGSLALQFPVTNRLWRDAAIESLGVPMFVADVDLDMSQRGAFVARVSEADQQILSVSVQPGGPLLRFRQRQATYGSLDGNLMVARTSVALVGQMRPRGARLELGSSHPVAAMLGALDIERRAVMSFSFGSGQALLGRPEAVGRAGPLPRHQGLEVPFGRYTVRHHGSPPLDQYLETDGLRPFVIS